MNDENLKKGVATRFKSGDELVAIARRGGIASGKVRRERADARRAVQILLGLTIQKGRGYDIDKAKCVGDVKNQNVTLLDSLILKQIQRANNGSLDALKFLIEQAGQGAINLDQIEREQRAEERNANGINAMDVEEEEQETNATLTLLEGLKNIKIEGVDDESELEPETLSDIGSSVKTEN